MKNQIHILNGDMLKNQLPECIKGEFIVMRECLVDGEVNGCTLDDLCQTRANFISHNYEGCSEQSYYDLVVPEFKKIQCIDEDSDINLWFEDDLFCQVNFWFTCYALNSHHTHSQITHRTIFTNLIQVV